MDVKDYTQGLNDARAKYRTAQDELRSNYEKNTEDVKNNYENKLKKQRASFDGERATLSEQNAINENRYNDITKKTIQETQNEYLESIKENRSSLEEQRARDRQTASERLSHLRNEYERSTLENSRLHDVAMKNVKERYDKNLNQTEKGFNQQIKNLDERSRVQSDKNVLDSRKNLENLSRKKDSEINELRASGVEDRSKILNRLKEDNEAQKTSFDSDIKNMQTQQEGRIKDLVASKIEENERNQENFSSLQTQIKKRNAYDQEKIHKEHAKDAKVREKQFNDDLRNVQRVANQKINSGSGVYAGKSNQDKIIQNYEEKLSRLKENMKEEREFSTLKENKISSDYREEMRVVKDKNIAQLEDQDKQKTQEFNNNLERIKTKNEEHLNVIKNDNSKILAQKDNAIYDGAKESKRAMDSQRVEFGKIVNSLNERSMETLSSIKDEFAKDKSEYIEKSKRDYNQELTSLKADYQKQLELKEHSNEKKMAEMEKQIAKVVDAYENKIAQIQRKTGKELESLKLQEDERRAKESQARSLELSTLEAERQNEIKQIRDKYERMIYKDRSDTEKVVNKIVQRYEDQLSRERLESQKELNMKLSEAQANLEKMFKATELEKATLRQQFEDRIDSKNS